MSPFFILGYARDDHWGEINAGFRLVRGGASIGFQAETSVGRQGCMKTATPRASCRNSERNA